MNNKELQATDHADSYAAPVSGDTQLPSDAAASAHETATTSVSAWLAESSQGEAVETLIDPLAQSLAEPSVNPAGSDVPSQTRSTGRAWRTGEPLPGGILAARRQELRWSLDEAVTRLKLTPRQITALEANDFASLPGMSSARGFIRSYAKAMGLDPEPLLAMLASEPNPAHDPMVLRRPLPSNGFPGRPSSPPPRKIKWRNRIILALVFLACGVATAVEAYRSQWVQLPPLEGLMVGIPLPDITSIFGASLSTLSREVAEKLGSASDQATEGEVPETGKPQAMRSPAAADALQLKLSEDAWVEITTVNGDRIVSQLIKGGSAVSFDNTEPSVLVVGNASAVEARLRGQLLNLKAVARDNVSKLSIK